MSRLCRIVLVCVLVGWPFRVGAIEAGTDTLLQTSLRTPATRMAATACQQAIAKAGATFVKLKLKRLDACSSRVLTCVQTKPGSEGCLANARDTCARALETDLPVAADKLVEKVVKKCGAKLRLGDLLASDGLGFGHRVAECQTDFRLDLCGGGVPAIAKCVQAELGRGAERLFAVEQPRAAELITGVLGDAPRDLDRHPGCGSCSEFPSESVGVAVSQCATATTKAGRIYAAAVLGRIDECLTKTLGCIQKKPLDPDCSSTITASCDQKAVDETSKCLAKATRKCATTSAPACLSHAHGACDAKATAKRDRCLTSGTSKCAARASAATTCLARARARCDALDESFRGDDDKLVAGVAKRCVDDSRIPFSTLTSSTALNVQALADTCAAFDIPDLTDLGDYIGCLRDHHMCLLADLATLAAPRTQSLAAAGLLGPVMSALTEDHCVQSPVLRQPLPSGARAFFFGSIVKFVRAIRRPRVGIDGVRVAGPRPPSRGGFGPGVRLVGPPTRFAFGGLTKIPFRYRASASRGRAAEPPPTLIVTVERDDILLADHFEVALDPLPPGTEEIDDELEVVYEDLRPLVDDEGKPAPGCAFTLALATRVGEDVSAYTTVLQVADADLPSPSPVLTPTAAITPTASATLALTPTTVESTTPTPTATSVVGPTATATLTGTPSATASSTSTPSPTATVTPTSTVTATPDATTTATVTRTPTVTATASTTATTSPTRTRTPIPTTTPTATATPLFGAPASAIDVVVPPDRTIVLAGTCPDTGTFALARFLPSGALDPTFGTDGLVLAPGGSAAAMVRQTDGKLVVVGSGDGHARVVRYSEDGTLDPTFGSGGVTAVILGVNGSAFTDVGLQADGKIVAGGWGATGSGFGFRRNGQVARFETNGTLDTDFGVDGITATGLWIVNAIAIQPDDAIVVTGDTRGLDSSGIASQRFTKDGVPDSAPLPGVDFGGKYETGRSVTIQPDQKILIGGSSQNTGSAPFLRYLPDGNFDPDFDGDGSNLVADFPAAPAIAVDPQQKILIPIGSGGLGAVRVLSVARRNEDGSADAGFGTGGIAASPVTKVGETTALTFDPDGSVIVVGTVNSDFAIVRYVGDVPTLLYSLR